MIASQVEAGHSRRWSARRISWRRGATIEPFAVPTRLRARRSSQAKPSRAGQDGASARQRGIGGPLWSVAPNNANLGAGQPGARTRRAKQSQSGGWATWSQNPSRQTKPIWGLGSLEPEPVAPNKANRPTFPGDRWMQPDSTPAVPWVALKSMLSCDDCCRWTKGV